MQKVEKLKPDIEARTIDSDGQSGINFHLHYIEFCIFQPCTVLVQGHKDSSVAIVKVGHLSECPVDLKGRVDSQEVQNPDLVAEISSNLALV